MLGAPEVTNGNDDDKNNIPNMNCLCKNCCSNRDQLIIDIKGPVSQRSQDRSRFKVLSMKIINALES